ncbi:dermonecrotic toxin SPH-like [Haemaphysalis longicornis]
MPQSTTQKFAVIFQIIRNEFVLNQLQVFATDIRRPVYVFGHMANTLEEFDQFMGQGVNAIEADVTFSPNGTALKFYHGPGCDTGRDCYRQTEIGTYLTYVKDTVSAEQGNYSDKMLLLYADIKTANLHGKKRKYNAGASLAEKLVQYLWKKVPPKRMVNVLLSTFWAKDRDIFRGALEKLSSYKGSAAYLDHVGFDVSGYSFLSTISKLYEDLGVTRHRWQGDGAQNHLIDLYPTIRMSLVTKRRTSNSSTKNYVDKAYVWTADSPCSIRRFLRKDIDGIVTNKPSNVLKVLQEKEFSKTLRLATSADNPWERVIRRNGNAIDGFTDAGVNQNCIFSQTLDMGLGARTSSSSQGGWGIIFGGGEIVDASLTVLLMRR